MVAYWLFVMCTTLVFMTAVLFYQLDRINRVLQQLKDKLTR